MAAKSRAGGVLPINAAATKKEKSGQGHVRSSPRSQAPKLRLIVRRLPPGLTEGEFWAALGDEWQVGKGKVDWAAFKDGKVSKDPAKPSRPARGYLKVKDQTLLDELSATVRQTPFQDAKNTSRDPCLIGPPSLEFAPYNKLPSGRVRNDGRQGTIDQDQEFIDFLQSLTEPITKATANGADADGTQEKITTTPLVQYLKEKKANKAKEAAEKKSSKARQQETKEGKQAKTEKSTVVVKGSNSTSEKARVNKATQDTVKAINKSVASMQTKSAPAATKTEEKSSAKGSPAATQPATKRERGSAAAAARMVQRDLGLAPKAPRAPRAAAAAAASTQAATPTKAEVANTEKNTTPAADTKATAASTPTPTPPTGPRSTRNAPAAAATNTPSPAAPASKAASGPKVKAAPQPSPGAKSAFLKHANPSQGVTEDLLRTAFSTFGTVTRCEIDKKKGLGYIDFDEADSLRKAMASSPVKIGEKGGQVVVLENRNIAKGTKAAAAKSAATPAAAAATKADATPTASPKPAAATPVDAASSPAVADTPPATKAAAMEAATTPAAASTSSATAPATTTPPTAPRGNAARGGGNPRGGRGGASQPGRGGGRGGFRGRGYGRGRGGAGGAAAAATSATGAAQLAPAATAPTGGGGEAK